MNKRIYLIILLLACRICSAQTPNWQWAYCGGGNGHDMGRGIITDASGNIYATGNFDPPSITFGSITLAATGARDAFVVKYDASGNVKWAKKFGGIYSESGLAITADYFGGIYITGTFNSPSIIFNNDTIINNGIGNVFIAKFDSSGNEIWATSAGGTGSGAAYSIGVDVFGNTCITGKYNSPTITFGSTTLSNSGQFDVFIAKFDASGNPLWAKKAGGNGVEEAYSVCSDLVGNVYATGSFWSDSITIDNTTIGKGGWANLYVAKFDASGNMLWLKSAGGVTGFESALSLAMTIDNSGNSYITGVISGTGITFGTYSLSSNGAYNDVMVVKYDGNGNVLFAKKAGGGNTEWGEGISIDAGGNLYVTGRYEGGAAQFGTTTLPNNGYSDCHVTKFDASGNVMWAVGFGGLQFEWCTGIANNANGSIYITGQFRSTSIALGGIILTNASIDTTADYFIAKLGSTTGLFEENYSTNSTTIYPNPFSNKLTIAAGNKELSEIILYDIASRLLLRQKFLNSISLNTEQLTKGVYIYEVKNKNGLCTKGKIVKD
ncbi:MAG: T9SS type A sorting domain-containing protein [Bacteroidia bacterium]